MERSIIVCVCLQCGPEYKLPGLYVVDSIVRQSRHQFGTEKDVFGPRFSKNFEKTFRNIFLCTPSDQVCIFTMCVAFNRKLFITSPHCMVTVTISFQPKIMRVLNLWQKNEVFPTGVIQKLMALAPNPGKSESFIQYSATISRKR